MKSEYSPLRATGIFKSVFIYGSSPNQLEKNQDPRVQGVQGSSEKALNM